jgi:hypothetical protein
MRALTPAVAPSSLLKRIRARLAAEEGMSLVLALGFLLIFSISTAAIVNELVLNQSAAIRDQTMITALGAAEAELSFAQQWVQAKDPNLLVATGTAYPQSTDTPNSTLASGDTPSSSTRYYTGSSVAGATNTGWWAHKYDGATCNSLDSSADATKACWVVDGRATVGLSTREVWVILNGNNTNETTTTLATTATNVTTVTNTNTNTVTSTVTVTTTQSDYGSWGFGTYSSGVASTCYTISGNGGISEPVYTPGNLCLTGNGYIHQNSSNNVTLVVKGTLSTSSGSFAGTSTSKLTSATVGSCTSGGSAVICSNGASSHLYANTYSSSGGTINKPSINLNTLYSSADPGPQHPCSIAAGSTASSTWPTFDTDTTRNNSVSTVQPFTSTSYTCKTATGGWIDWNASTHVFGIHNSTVFIDGNLSFNSATVVYQGRGNIYYNGTVAMSGNSVDYICPAANCPTDGSWNMAVNLLLIAAGNQGTVPTTCGYTWTMSGNAIFQGAAYTNGCVQESGNGGIEGPAIADGYSISGNGTYYQPLGSNTLPPGAPVNSVSTSTTTVTTSTVTSATTGIVTNITTTSTPTEVNPWGQLATSWRQLK